jgi:hypothetical protein
MHHQRALVATVRQSRVTCPRARTTAAPSTASRWGNGRRRHVNSHSLAQAPSRSPNAEKSEGPSPVSVTEAAASFRLSPVAQRSPGAAAPGASDWHKVDALVALYTNVVQAAASPLHARRHVRARHACRHAVRCALEARLTPARTARKPPADASLTWTKRICLAQEHGDASIAREARPCLSAAAPRGDREARSCLSESAVGPRGDVCWSSQIP